MWYLYRVITDPESRHRVAFIDRQIEMLIKVYLQLLFLKYTSIKLKKSGRGEEGMERIIKEQQRKDMILPLEQYPSNHQASY